MKYINAFFLTLLTLFTVFVFSFTAQCLFAINEYPVGIAILCSAALTGMMGMLRINETLS